MSEVIDKISKLAKEVSEAHQSIEDQAKSSICIFLIGCFCPKHKPYLIQAKERIINEKKIPSMILDDFNMPSDGQPHHDYSIKFKAVMDKILKTFRIPKIFMLASDPTDSCNGGENAELVTICENPKYEKLKANFRIFSEDGAKLPDHHKHVPSHVHVKDGGNFVTAALNHAEMEKNIMIDILSKDIDEKSK